MKKLSTNLNTQWEFIAFPRDIFNWPVAKEFKEDFMLSNWKLDEEYEVIIRKKQKHRSNKMNRYMWGEVIPKVQFGLRILGTKLSAQGAEKIVVDLL